MISATMVIVQPCDHFLGQKVITLKIIHSVFLVLFSLSNENRFDYTFWHSSFCRY